MAAVKHTAYDRFKDNYIIASVNLNNLNENEWWMTSFCQTTLCVLIICQIYFDMIRGTSKLNLSTAVTVTISMTAEIAVISLRHREILKMSDTWLKSKTFLAVLV